ncbi:MAG TPA: helix-turn-helix domain-containing protein [Micromonosporaceae bacterium]|nr:helix-turn-helix domain-containing protein [Micromonosporaceae bacterium]
MEFRTHTPAPALRPYVAEAHGYRVSPNPTGIHRGLPSRHLTLVVELIEPLRVGGVGGSVAAHGVVGGLHMRPALIDASRPQEGLQYGLTPYGALALLGVPAAELAGITVDLVDLFGAGAVDLVERLHDTPTWPERFRLLDTALLRRLDDSNLRLPPEVAEAWRMIFASDGRVRVAAVAGHVGCSRRYLSERFRHATGLTPKLAARIARFEAARRSLTAAHRLPLVDIAVGCGYADQSHLSREWQEMAGCSVGTWLREEFPFVHDGSPAARAESLT